MPFPPTFPQPPLVRPYCSLLSIVQNHVRVCSFFPTFSLSLFVPLPPFLALHRACLVAPPCCLSKVQCIVGDSREGKVVIVGNVGDKGERGVTAGREYKP